MIVIKSEREGTFTELRASFRSTYRKNGTFVDIWFERDGRRQRVSVPTSEFMDFVQSDDKERKFGLYYSVSEDDPIFKRWEEAEFKSLEGG